MLLFLKLKQRGGNTNIFWCLTRSMQVDVQKEGKK